jgi:hypothetical protein
MKEMAMLNAELTLVRTTDEIFKEYEEVSNRLEKAQDRLTQMKEEGFSDGMIQDMRMCVQRLAAKKEVFWWLVQ